MLGFKELLLATNAKFWQPKKKSSSESLSSFYSIHVNNYLYLTFTRQQIACITKVKLNHTLKYLFQQTHLINFTEASFTQ